MAGQLCRDYAPGSGSIKYATFTGTNGNVTLVAAVTGKKIRVISLCISLTGNGTLAIQSGAGGTALTGTMPLLGSTPLVLQENPSGWFETAASTLLNASVATSTATNGHLSYIEI